MGLTLSGNIWDGHKPSRLQKEAEEEWVWSVAHFPEIWNSNLMERQRPPPPTHTHFHSF